MRSHAAVPIAEALGGDLFRIYFSTRDSANRSHTGSLVLDITRPTQVIEIAPDPVLVPGELGEFDDSGAMASWLTQSAGRRHLYYIGWNLGVTVPFRNSIGLATSDGGSSFSRFANGPIVDRTMTEPHFCASCCVLEEKGFWRMWYLSCTGWSGAPGQPRHSYHIKYAESRDGIHWLREGSVAIDFSGPGEYAISRPCVLRDGDLWKMWYSHRGEAYRIGYAESPDGRTWLRKDSESGIDVSASGWDSEMIEYPFVFDHRGKRYMLYNGNGYGKTGFGLAVLEAE
ncbi:glycoside hydrolase family protein [Caenimonas soli]|uniref:hypothetical protein n=1 Tax=Caenimonas soli TaxID=2735555 RepID=UPI001F48F79B|nr:hypothetical protein [Caenimonas soli]